MKLRNKKTGEIFTNVRIMLAPYTEGVRGARITEYDSLAELNEEWEDYNPDEPLIKDEKIRKAVRAWAEAMGLDAVDYEEGEFGIVFYSTDNMDDCKYRIEFSQYLDYLKSGYDSIADLCGE